MLTQYDEYPVHQSPYPFSMIPSTDVAWDDGYYHAVFGPDDGVFLTMSMRVNANTDIVGGHATITADGVQHSIRMSRVWRPDCDTHIGPYKIDFPTPMKHVRLRLDPNDSPVSYDLNWHGWIPPFLEDHHSNIWRGRKLTDQSRYVQVGAPEGWIRIGDKSFEVTPDRWAGSRDHSWGLYENRRPLAGLSEYLPPMQKPSDRVMRFWSMFRLPGYGGFFSFREDKHGVCRTFDGDMDGTAMEGIITFGWEGRTIHLKQASHQLRFREGTRVLTGGTVNLLDEEGGEWVQEFTVGTIPWVQGPTGRSGGWNDGGSVHTYHGDGPVLEWERINVSNWPKTDYKGGGGAMREEKGTMIYGCRTTMRAPDGSSSDGFQHITLSFLGDYLPYGFVG